MVYLLDILSRRITSVNSGYKISSKQIFEFGLCSKVDCGFVSSAQILVWAPIGWLYLESSHSLLL